jgi:ribosomal protein S20
MPLTGFSNTVRQALTQEITNPAETAKIFIKDASEALKNNDTAKATTRLNLVSQQLENAGNSSIVQAARVFLRDSIDALKNHDSGKALDRLNFVVQKLANSYQLLVPFIKSNYSFTFHVSSSISKI